MGQLVLATLVFLATHFVPATPLRAALVRAIGERAYLAVYSIVALAGIIWMVWAYNRAPLQPLWQVSAFRLVPLVVMPFSLILIAAGLMGRNPTAVGQGSALKASEPARGMIRVTRHPFMWGVILWALAHILARGDVASLVFFGGFFVLAALGGALIDGRKAALGEDWKRFADVTSNVPFAAIAGGRNRFDLGEIGWKRIGAGLALYVILLAAHPYLFGARPY